MNSMKTLGLKNLSSWTMFVFGALAVLLGLPGLIKPAVTLKLMGLNPINDAERTSDDYTPVFVKTASMASVNMGIYYMLAALNNMKRFYIWTVPFRGLTFTVFSLSVLRGYAPPRLLGVAVWELLGAVFTGLALFIERDKSE